MSRDYDDEVRSEYEEKLQGIGWRWIDGRRVPEAEYLADLASESGDDEMEPRATMISTGITPEKADEILAELGRVGKIHAGPGGRAAIVFLDDGSWVFAHGAPEDEFEETDDADEWKTGKGGLD